MAHTPTSHVVSCAAQQPRQSCWQRQSAREGDEEQVLSAYNSSRGRSRVETMLLGQACDRLKREVQGFLTLLKYWRDQAGHGATADISDNEAYTSLALLLRFAAYVNDCWGELTEENA